MSPVWRNCEHDESVTTVELGYSEAIGERANFGANPPYETVYSNLTYTVPTPEIGDARGLADVVKRIKKMTEAMMPLVTEYFEQRQTGDT